jgi:DDE superfamily endonuclease
MDALRPVREFRALVSACFTRRRNVLCDLLDVMTAAGPRPSLAYLSLAAPSQRHSGSVYAALRHGRISVEALCALLVRYPLAASPPVYAVNVSVWPRCDAETSPECGFYYHPSHHLDGAPVVKGWAYQWPAQLGSTRESWTAPVNRGATGQRTGAHPGLAHHRQHVATGRAQDCARYLAGSYVVTHAVRLGDVRFDRGRPVAPGQRQERGRLDRALQVDVQLRLGRGT